MGSTGEYSDHFEWMVKAFYSKEKAEKLVVNADRRAKEIFVQFKNDYRDWQDKVKNEYDPNMQLDYTGTNYHIYEVELE